MGFFGKLFLGFWVVVAVLAIIGLFLRRRDAKKGLRSDGEEVLSRKTVENAADLNDRFIRARYQDEDGK